MKVNGISQKSINYLSNPKLNKDKLGTVCAGNYDYEIYKYPKNGAQVSFSGKYNCSFLSSKQISLIINSLINNFEDINIRDLKKQIDILKKTVPSLTDSKFLFNIVGKCEFCNIKDYDKIIKYIQENNFHLILTDDIGIGNALAYLITKRNSTMQMKKVPIKIPLAELPQRIMKMKKNAPAIIISKDTIVNLEKLAKESPEDFFKIVKHVNFIYPHGNINGVNPFSLISAQEIAKKGLMHECDEAIIDKFLKLCNDVIKRYSPENPFPVQFHDIRNTMSYSFDALINRLKYKHRFFEQHDSTFMPMARFMRKFQKDAGYDFFEPTLSAEKTALTNALLAHSQLYTPIKINRALKTIHTKIQKMANGADVVYYLPNFSSPKSFNYVLNNYFMINDVPKEKLVKDLSQVLPSQKVVILDDYIGSGESMTSQFLYMTKNNIPKENIIIASIAGTKRGLSEIKKYTDNIVTERVIEQFDITKSSIFKKAATQAEKDKLQLIAKEMIIGGYNGGKDDFSTFYMSPNNNNNLFFANIAPGFVVSSYGIKPAFNTFNDTIMKADLSKLLLSEVGEIVNIYKKNNAVLPECLIRKISQIASDDTDYLITVLNTYGKIKPETIPADIAKYLQKGLANIDIQKIDNIFLIDNIMDICKTLKVEPPIKFVAQMINELQRPKSKIGDDVLLHFYLKLIDQLAPINDVNEKIYSIIKNLTPAQMTKFNILEDVFGIADKRYFPIPNNVTKRVKEILKNIEQNGISMELLNMIIKTRQIDLELLDKTALQKWWTSLPEYVRVKASLDITSYINGTHSADIGGTI